MISTTTILITTKTIYFKIILTQSYINCISYRSQFFVIG
jgi:hypothetical protein